MTMTSTPPVPSPAAASSGTSAGALGYKPRPLMPKKKPLSQRINVRFLSFAVVMLAIVGYPVYTYLDSTITGGVKDLGSGVKQVDLKAMSNFPLDQNNGVLEDIPSKWRDLDGKKVVLYGEMWQPMSAGTSDVKSFQLCYSIAKCCFSGPPQVQHFVQSIAAPGASLEYYENLVRVTGTLHVHVIKAEGKLSSVYQLEVLDIQPAT